MRRFLIIILGISIVGIGIWYFYTKSHQVQPKVPSTADFSSFFPTGDTTTPASPAGALPPTTQTSGSGSASAVSPFKQVSPHPIAGYSIFTQPVSVVTPPDPTVPKSKATTQTVSHHMLRYVSRGNGYVYEIDEGSIPLQISNVYIPNVYEAVFGDKFATAILRFLRTDQQTIATYSVPIPPPNPDGTRTQKEGTYLPDNITTMAVSPDGSQIARVTDDTGGALVRLSTTTNTKGVDLVHTPFQEWLISWPTQKSIYLQTKASAQVPGYLYRVDTVEKKLRRVLGDVNGLTASVSPSGAYIMYAQHTDGGFTTRLLNTKTGETKSLSLALLPEKCAWLKNDDLICAGNTTVPTADYPDAWYQGVVTFSDRLYHIYTGTAVYDTLYDDTGRSFDMTNIVVDESSRKVYFIDKPTGLLWQLMY